MPALHSSFPVTRAEFDDIRAISQRHANVAKIVDWLRDITRFKTELPQQTFQFLHRQWDEVVKLAHRDIAAKMTLVNCNNLMNLVYPLQNGSQMANKTNDVDFACQLIYDWLDNNRGHPIVELICHHIDSIRAIGSPACTWNEEAKC